MKAKTPRLGRVYFSASYVVDLDDADMIDEAKECVMEDVMNAVKHDETPDWVKVEADPKLKAADIPEFLMESRKMRAEA